MESEAVTAAERAPRRQHLVEHAPERPDVRLLIDRLASRLLRAHVGGRPHHRPHARRQRRRPGLLRLGLREPEVEHLDAAAGGDLDVGGFQIAMDDALGVRGRERFRDLAGDAHGLADRQRSLARSDRPASRRRRAPAPGRGRHPLPRCRRWRSDVRMIERGQGARLAAEPRQPIGILRAERRQDLDRDVASELRVAGAIHLAHAARADRRVNPVGAERPADE